MNNKNEVTNLIKLSTNVMLTLLTDKKDNKAKSSDPLISTIKTLVKIFNFISFNDGENLSKIK